MEHPLQTLTESEAILRKKKIVPEDLVGLSAEQRKSLETQINEHLSRLNGQELNDYVDKIETIVPGKTDLRHQQWELNHIEIGRVISNFMKENQRPPSKNEIAKETNLSRQTIHSHLMEFESSSFYQVEKQKLKLMNHKIMTKVYQYACTGNVKAARLYFEMTGELGNRSTKNYFIQINNLRVNEDVIKALPPEALTEIESIIYKSIPKQIKLNENEQNRTTPNLSK